MHQLMGNLICAERHSKVVFPKAEELAWLEKEQELQQREQELQLREQKLLQQTNGPPPRDVWSNSGISAKSNPADDFVATLASKVVLLEQQKHRLEEALTEALAKRDGDLQIPKPAAPKSRRSSALITATRPECATTQTMLLLDKLMRGVTPEMSEVLKVRDAVLLLAANKGRQGVHEKKGLQQQMNSNLNNIQVSGDEEVRAALMQLLNDQSEADFMAVLNEAAAPDRPPLPGQTYAEWLIGQDNEALKKSRSENLDGEDGERTPSAFGSGDRANILTTPKRKSLKQRVSENNMVGPTELEASRPLRTSISYDEQRALTPTTPKPVHSLQRSMSRTVRMFKSPSEPVMTVLEKIDDWHFDAFELDEVTGGRPLSTLAFALFTRYQLIAKYQINEVKLARFLCRLEDNYSENPYHNRIHAADVLRTLHVINTRGGVGEALDKAQDIAIIGTYLAAIIHDFEHKGVNNDFLVKSRDILAITYNDRSPMENHHAAAAWGLLLSNKECEAFSDTNPKVLEVLRKMVVDIVLATDMKQHFSLTSLWNAKIPMLLSSAPSASQSEVPDLVSKSSTPGSRPESARKKAWDTGNGGAPAPQVLGKLVVEDEELRTLVLQTAMKCADLGHLTHKWEVHRKWVEALEEEMWRQGDAEKARGMPVSPLMDRAKGGITKSQQGFFDYVVLPQIKGFCKVFPKCTPLLDSAMQNYHNWVNGAP